MTKRRKKSDWKDKWEKLEGDRFMKLLNDIWEQKVIFITEFKMNRFCKYLMVCLFIYSFISRKDSLKLFA